MALFAFPLPWWGWLVLLGVIGLLVLYHWLDKRLHRAIPESRRWLLVGHYEAGKAPMQIVRIVCRKSSRTASGYFYVAQCTTDCVHWHRCARAKSFGSIARALYEVCPGINMKAVAGVELQALVASCGS